MASTDEWNYIGLTKGNIKDRISKHEQSFNNFLKEHETRLSTKMWELKREGPMPKLKWQKMTIAPTRGPNQKTCVLCNKEALMIMRSNNKNINLKSEMGGFCPHRRWHLLNHIKCNREGNKVKISADSADNIVCQ